MMKNFIRLRILKRYMFNTKSLLNHPLTKWEAFFFGEFLKVIEQKLLYQRGIVSIPKTVTKTRVLENASIFDFTLDADDTAKLNAFDVGYRTVRPLFWQPYTNYPFDAVAEKIPEIPLTHLKWKNGANFDIE